MKKEITKIYEAVVFRHFYLDRGLRGALEVAVPRGRVDYMAIDRKDLIYCLEIKTSVQDFGSKHGHNFVGHKNYYVMPYSVYLKVQHKIPKHIGVYTVKKAKYINRDSYDTMYKTGMLKYYYAYELVNLKKAKTVAPTGKQGNKLQKRSQDQLKKNVLTACNSTIVRLMKDLMRSKDVEVTKEAYGKMPYNELLYYEE